MVVVGVNWKNAPLMEVPTILPPVGESHHRIDPFVVVAIRLILVPQFTVDGRATIELGAANC